MKGNKLPMLPSCAWFSGGRSHHIVPVPDARQDYRAVLSHSPPILTACICSLVYAIHWTPGSATGLLFTGKTAWYTAEQIIFPHLQLWCCFVNKGGERSWKTPWHNLWKDKHRNLAVRWKSLMRGTTIWLLYMLWGCITLTHKSDWKIEALLWATSWFSAGLMPSDSFKLRGLTKLLQGLI